MAPDQIPSTYRNILLQKLGPGDLALLTPHLTHVELAIRDDIEKPNRPIKHILFLEAGMVSIVARGAKKKQLEVGIVGREGMTGLMVVLGGDRSPHSTYIQIAGNGHRMASDDLRRAMAASASLREILLAYAQAFLLQATYTAASNGSGKLEERLARWLLMAHDRVDSDELPLVHDFLALMLGVRRPGVTVALHSLEGRGLIRAARGKIAVIDREGLEEVANASYGVPEAEYARLLDNRRGADA